MLLEPGPRLGGDAGELDGEGFETAQRPRRLGELRLARLGGAHRRPVEGLDAGDGLGELVGHAEGSSSVGEDDGTRVAGGGRGRRSAPRRYRPCGRARLGRERVGGQRLELDGDAGHQQVDALGGVGQAPVRAAELVAIETGDGVLGNDPQPDLVGDGDHGRAGLAQGGEQVVERRAHARGYRLFDLARDERLVEVAEALGLGAAQAAGREQQVADPERDAVEQEDRTGGGAAHRRPRLERALERDPGLRARRAVGGHASHHLGIVGLGGGEVGHRGRGVAASGDRRLLRRQALGERALAAARAAHHQDEASRLFG